MTKKYVSQTIAALAALLIGSGCSTYHSNDRTHQAITRVEAVHFKPVFEIGQRKINGMGAAGGFFNFDTSMPSFSIPGIGASNSSAFVEPSLFEGLTATEAEALRDAIYKTCKANNAEYLLMPHFEIRTREFPILTFIWSKSYCTISGIPANVKKVEVVEKQEEAKVDVTVSAESKKK